METKQTAVEWFYDQITRTYWDYMTSEQQNLLFEQAKQIEKEHIMMAWDNGDCCIDLPNGDWEQKYKSSEQYYNETFKQQDK